MDLLEDKKSRLGVNKYAYSREEPRGKVSDVSRAYIEGWELIGETRYYDVARKMGDFRIDAGEPRAGATAANSSLSKRARLRFL